MVRSAKVHNAIVEEVRTEPEVVVEEGRALQVGVEGRNAPEVEVVEVQ